MCLLQEEEKTEILSVRGREEQVPGLRPRTQESHSSPNSFTSLCSPCLSSLWTTVATDVCSLGEQTKPTVQKQSDWKAISLGWRASSRHHAKLLPGFPKPQLENVHDGTSKEPAISSRVQNERKKRIIDNDCTAVTAAMIGRSGQARG